MQCIPKSVQPSSQAQESPYQNTTPKTPRSAGFPKKEKNLYKKRKPRDQKAHDSNCTLQEVLDPIKKVVLHHILLPTSLHPRFFLLVPHHLTSYLDS